MCQVFEVVLNRNKGTNRIMGYVDYRGCYVCSSYAVEKDTGYIQTTHDGHHTRLHRLIYESFFGTKIPKGLKVRHTCHNKTCCNPLHYALGTAEDNSRDNVDNPNMNNVKRKLTLHQKRAIVKNTTKTNVELAEHYAVPVRTIYKIKQDAKNGKTFTSKDKPSIPKKRRANQKIPSRK